MKFLRRRNLALCLSAGLLYAATASQRMNFEDITVSSGVRFVNENGASPDKKMIETMGSGVGLLDYDSDGRLDLIFVNGGGKPGSAEASHNRLALYRNLGNGKFEDRTAAAHLTGSFDTYGMGVAVADFDNDGRADLLLTGYPRSALFHNNGDGTFSDVTAAAGVENKGRWATSAGWFDYDHDGLLDLVIANYVGDFSWDDSRFCGDAARSQRAYCHPDVYQGTGVRLYHNQGNGRFADVTAKAGLASAEGKCLGLVLADFDGDGWPDIFVANDSVMNFFYRNRGDGKFEEIGLVSGTGFSEDGQAEAGMGVDAAYLTGDAHPSIYVTHLDNELNRLYRNVGKDGFHDATIAAGLGAERSLLSGFGVRFADFDNSGRQQILVANGHILDNIALFHPRVAYRELLSLFGETAAGQFRDLAKQSGAVFTQPLLGRGLAVGDLDDDGLLDFVGEPELRTAVDRAQPHGWGQLDHARPGRRGKKQPRCDWRGGDTHCGR